LVLLSPRDFSVEVHAGIRVCHLRARHLEIVSHLQVHLEFGAAAEAAGE
jgi:hypothetical protein